MEHDRRTVLVGLASTMVGAACGPGTAGTERGDSADTGLSTPDTGTAPDPTDTAGSITDTADPTGTTDTGPPPGYVTGRWEPEGSEDLGVFPHGIQAGDVTTASAILSVRAAAPEVLIEVVGIDDTGWWPVHEAVHFLDDRAAQVEVTGLRPGTTYGWVARTTPSTRSVQGTFRTPPATGDDRVIRFGAVSCLGGNEPWPCLTRAAEEALDVFLFLGDTIYADWGYTEPVQEKWDTALAQQGMRDLTASTSIIATWDDHEVRNNFTPENTSSSEIDEGRRAFREALPQRVGPEGQIWRKLSWGEVDFFVLDCRGERVDGNYISPAQLDWLREALSQSTARFKIILNSVPITDLSFIPIAGDIDAYDRWQGFPAQRQELVDHCAGIPGVLFLSGDFHVGAAAYIEPPSSVGADLKEILCGPGGSPINSAYAFIPEGGRLPKVVAKHNVTLFECDPTTGNLSVQWIADDGRELARLDVRM